MSPLEALEEVENTMTALGLKDRYGEPIVGIEAAGIVALGTEDKWDALAEAFEKGAISPSEYVETAKGLIEIFVRAQFTGRVNARLRDLLRDQSELDLSRGHKGVA